jgi:hypothetical protein
MWPGGEPVADRALRLVGPPSIPMAVIIATPWTANISFLIVLRLIMILLLF